MESSKRARAAGKGGGEQRDRNGRITRRAALLQRAACPCSAHLGELLEDHHDGGVTATQVEGRLAVLVDERMRGPGGQGDQRHGAAASGGSW